MNSNHLTEKQTKVLCALARYKFLTYSQMQRLGIERHRSNLSNVMTSLRDRRVSYVRKIPHQFGVEAKHYLTKKGKDLLCNMDLVPEEEIHFPKGIITVETQDQKHRTSIIDIQIELDLAALQSGVDVLFCDRYFDTTGSNKRAKKLKSKTALLYEDSKTLKPDMIFKLKTPKQEELYLLELENGKDAQKAVPKCLMHGKAILRGSANHVYNHPRGYRTLWIFEHASTMRAVQEKISTLNFFTHLHEYFLFKPLETISTDFFSGWTNLMKKERRMWY